MIFYLINANMKFIEEMTVIFYQYSVTIESKNV